jgi:hypothetical protein
MTMTMTAPSPTSAVLRLQRIKREIAVVDIEGTAPLIVHQWSEKARRMMLDAQMGRKTPKTPKDPEQDFLDSMYRFNGTDRNLLQPLATHGIPTMGLKAATVKGGGRAFGKSVKMTELRQALIFLRDGLGDDGIQLTRLIIPEEPQMREDMVRVGMGTADLIDAGGANGVGEWRPEKNGSSGTYRVVGEALA